jgi:CheY-like chemotaxis protein/HPt (histidine-containing phosphotransfer) domain-containing protein
MPDSTERVTLTTEHSSTQKAVGEAAGEVVEEVVEEVVKEGRQLRILLAEDSPTNQLIATINLEQAGYLVTVVDNGRKAVAALDEGRFDLVLMDVYMPEMDGLEATRTIRRIEETSGQHIPIVAMTGTDTQKHRQECLEAGMDGFITKPVTQCELHEAITGLLPKDQDLQMEKPEEAENPEAASTELVLSVNLYEALKVVDGDVELLRHVVEMFLEEHSTQMAVLRDALERQDWPGVESAAYKLKGVLGNVGGLTACDLVRQLEGIGETGNDERRWSMMEALEIEITRIVAFFSAPGWDKGILICE